MKQLESRLRRGLARGKPGRPKKKARALAAQRALGRKTGKWVKRPRIKGRRDQRELYQG